MKEKDEAIHGLVHSYALGILPAGCKFFDENGEITMGGELLTAIIMEKEAKEKGKFHHALAVRSTKSVKRREDSSREKIGSILKIWRQLLLTKRI